MRPFHSGKSPFSLNPSRPQEGFPLNSKSPLADHLLGVLAICLAVLHVFAGCATTLPKDVQRTPSAAFKKYDNTATGRIFEEATVQHPDESGFALIRKGRPAFTGRIAMTTMAEKTLDLQYYIWEADTTGRILALKLLAAADRGVRVRILVDDNNIANRDAPIAAIDAHPNIEVRTFNPFAHRGSRLFGYMTDFDRLNHRMHNKVIIVDNALAIVGGRNIGNHYFGVHTDANFRDLDIAAAGPIVRDLSDIFDRFWNGSWSYPISALVDRPYNETDLRETVAATETLIQEDDYPHPLDEDVEELRRRMREIRDSLIWAPGQVIWDDPSTIEEKREAAVMQDALHYKMSTLQEELLIESAYFVVLDRGVRTAKQLREKGVRVRVLTNSLASNDVVAAHAGYAKRRKQLLENGVELYELRPDARSATVKDKQVLAGSQSIAALHTKAMVFDRESVFVGSFNLDPRSAVINTEMGLYVESPELARQVIAYMDEGVLPYNAYRVTLDEKGEMVWTSQEDGIPVEYTREPKTTFWQRFTSGFIQMLPVEEQL
jgi:putative cardiolipin synthase